MNLKEWRDRLGWSQRRSASELGVTLRTYQQYERGRRFGTNQPVTIPKTVTLACQSLEAGE